MITISSSTPGPLVLKSENLLEIKEGTLRGSMEPGKFLQIKNLRAADLCFFLKCCHLFTSPRYSLVARNPTRLTNSASHWPDRSTARSTSRAPGHVLSACLSPRLGLIPAPCSLPLCPERRGVRSGLLFRPFCPIFQGKRSVIPPGNLPLPTPPAASLCPAVCVLCSGEMSLMTLSNNRSEVEAQR